MTRFDYNTLPTRRPLTLHGKRAPKRDIKRLAAAGYTISYLCKGSWCGLVAHSKGER